MTSAQLRSPYLHIPTRGARVLDEPVGIVERASAFSVALPRDVAFSHVTACALWDLWMPSSAHDWPLDVMRTSDRQRIRRSGCRGHLGLELRAVERHQDVRTVGLLDTWCDLGELTPEEISFRDLVMIGDCIANRYEEDGSAAVELGDRLKERVRARGAVLLRHALGLVRKGSRSPMESVTRVMFVEAGFPEPRINLDLDDGVGGWLLQGDLVWDEERVVVEYQGADHADRRARSHDADRAAVARDHDTQIFEVFAEDVHDRRRRIRLLVRVARALGLDPGALRIF